MKLYISADIEGVTGIANWEETNKDKSKYQYFADQMTKEVKSACEAANEVGVDEIVVKDAHGSARNIDPSQLPNNTKVIRGWSRHPYMMVDGIDNSFDAVAFIGYHSSGGSNKNPLAHTMSSSTIDYVKLNGEFASEFLLYANTAAYEKVPTAFISGDKGICEDAKKLNDNIKTAAVLEGKGSSTISIHPEKSIEMIKKGIKESLKGDLSKNKIELADKFTLEIKYNYHGDAYKNSFFPGVKQKSAKVIEFKTDDYFEIMRVTSFLL